MRWINETKNPKPLRFVITPAIFHNIKDGEDVEWFYIYVYENNCLIYDYLQNTLEIAKKFAFEKFNAPMDAY